jgi:YVTN family beta-propeller protein
VSVVDTGLQSVTATLTAGSQPTGLAIIARNPVAPVVVTPSAVAGTRTPAAGTKVTPTSGTATRAVPTVTTTRSNGPFLYVANYGSDDVSVIDLSTNRAVSKVTVGADPVAIAADPTNNRVFVANVGSSDLSVIGIADNQVDSRVRLDGRPSSVGVSTDGRYVYATLIAPTNAVQVINPTLITAGGTTALLTPTAGASPTRTPTGAASTGTPAAGTPAASATAAPTSTPVGPTRIAVGDNPSYVIFNSQGTRAFVANEGAGSISVIDTVSGAVVSTALVTGTPSMLYLLVGSGAATPVAPTAASLTTPVATGTPLPSR